jgi:NAD+ synthase (glutamine-hydrolysing)
MKIALTEMNVNLGIPEKNYEIIVKMAKKAKDELCDLIVFPEMAVGGYFIQDYYSQDSFCEHLESYDEKITFLSKELDIIIVWGNVFVLKTDETYEDGRKKKFNAVNIAEKGIRQVRFKTLLPNYREFNDKRWFASDPSLIKPITLRNGIRIGLEVCEDLWSSSYVINPTKKLVDLKADFIINISASPFSVDKSFARDKQILRLKEECGDDFVPFFYCNNIGIQNTGKNIIVFDGDSKAFDRNGKLVNISNNRNQIEGFTPYELDVEKKEIKKEKIIDQTITPVMQKFYMIISSFRNMHKVLGYSPNYIIGISGGIDSAVSAALATIAIGDNYVFGYSLPTNYNSKATKSAAAKLAKNLKIQFKEVPIKKIVKTLKPFFERIGNNTHEENLLSRIRGLYLQTQAGLNNGVVVCNANKLEIALGYCTYLGDDIGIFAPLGDLTKLEIYELAVYINKNYDNLIPSEMIPDSNLDFTGKIYPSAELRKEQKDPMLFGFDDLLINKLMNYNKTSPEEILEKYLDGTLVKWLNCPVAFDRYKLYEPKIFIDHLEWFLKTMQKNVFKRVQMPPVLLLSRTAFGNDLLESMFPLYLSEKYYLLKEQILNTNFKEKYNDY